MMAAVDSRQVKTECFQQRHKILKAYVFRTGETFSQQFSLVHNAASLRNSLLKLYPMNGLCLAFDNPPLNTLYSLYECA